MMPTVVRCRKWSNGNGANNQAVIERSQINAVLDQPYTRKIAGVYRVAIAALSQLSYFPGKSVRLGLL